MMNIIMLVLLCLLTLTQVYYRAPIHMLMLCSLCFFSWRETMRIQAFFFITVALYFVLYVVSTHNYAAANPIGLFLYYVTWPAAFFFCVSNCEMKNIKRLLYFLLFICLMGDVVSLKHLMTNSYISRLMAGAASESELLQYQRMGIGGYGYVYAMVFLTYGIVRWFRVTESKKEKLFLLLFFVVNTAFIVYSSYTLAIIFTVLLAVLAWLSNLRQGIKIFLVCVGTIMVYVLSSSIIELCYQMADAMELEPVAKRFHQLIQAQENESTSSLSRARLYMKSWTTFTENPLAGGDAIGGHSFMLDSLASYGITGMLFLVFFKSCMGLCRRIVGGDKLTILYFIFILFVFINTVVSMQIPVTLFFMVPLILYLEKERKQI